MATTDEYAAWIVKNADKRGTPQFDVVTKAYAAAKASASDPLSNPNMATEGMSGAQKFFAGVGKTGYDFARGAGQLMGFVSQDEIDSIKSRDTPLMKTGAGFAGNLAGNIVATLPIMAVPGVNTMVGAGLSGAALGGLTPVATGEDRATNIALGAGGGLLGQGTANLIGRAVKPVRSVLGQEQSRLLSVADNSGIPLSVAQRTGSKPLAIVESVLDNLPFTAAKQAAQKTAQREAFNRAVLKTAGEDSWIATPEVLNSAKTRIGSVFENLSAKTDVNLGNDFLNALVSVEASTNKFTKPAVMDAVEKALEVAANGKIDGRTYQKIRSTLSKQASDAFNGGNSELGQSLKTIRNAFDDAAGASISGADKSAWDQARKQWQALKSIERAAAPVSADAVAGNISPAKLAQAVTNGNRQGMTYGVGDQTLPDLARIGQLFIKEQIPNSGTAQRQLYQNMMTGGTGAGVAGLLMGAPPAAVAGLLAAGATPSLLQKFMTSQTGMKYLQRGLLDDGLVTQAGALLGRTSPNTGAALGLSVPQMFNGQ